MASYVVLVVALLTASMLLGSRTLAQTPTQEPTGNSITIEIANKFQQVVPATGAERRVLMIKNNNSDNCWVYIGGGNASKEKSTVLDPGSAYTRYWPFAPSEAIQATCASSSDILLVEYQ